jgi:hypothetical protein
MTRIDQTTIDYVASSAAPCRLADSVMLSPYLVAEEGYCVVVRALASKEVYNQIEMQDGDFRTIEKGDVFVAALGERQALKGYSGRLPRRIATGDTLHVLNMGGIIGLCTSDHPELGPALEVEILGAALVDHDGQLRHARIQDHALEPLFALESSAPLVMVSGTAMNTGKTYACGEIIRTLTEKGLRVAAAKLTGAALLRDVKAMEACGAYEVATFVDAGVVCSTGKDIAPLAKAVIAHLNESQPDVIVLELGDGFIGYYGVDDLLQDKELQKFTKAHVVAASDLAGAWAADQTFRHRYRAEITAFTGPVTDNLVGKQYIENALGVAACNARAEAESLGLLVNDAVGATKLKQAAPARALGMVI